MQQAGWWWSSVSRKQDIQTTRPPHPIRMKKRWTQPIKIPIEEKLLLFVRSLNATVNIFYLSTAADDWQRRRPIVSIAQLFTLVSQVSASSPSDQTAPMCTWRFTDWCFDKLFTQNAEFVIENKAATVCITIIAVITAGRGRQAGRQSSSSLLLLSLPRSTILATKNLLEMMYCRDFFHPKGIFAANLEHLSTLSTAINAI